MKLELKKLELTNYRNFEHEVFEFKGNSKIVGENKIGKTSILESIYWLLTDYLFGGSADLTRIKPIRDTSLTVEAKGTFQLDNEVFVLTKQYSELWQKQRNSEELYLKGHKTTYFIDDIKQPSQKVYNIKLKEKLGIKDESVTALNVFRLLVDPLYLGDTSEATSAKDSWIDLRKLIIYLIGDVKDEDVFKTNPDLKVLEADLFKYGQEELKKKFKQDCDALKDQIKVNEGYILKLEQTEKPSDQDVSIAKEAIEKHSNNIEELKKSKGIDANSQIIKDKINQKREEIVKQKWQDQEDFENSISYKHRQELENQQKELYSKSNALMADKNKLNENISNYGREISRIEYQIEYCKDTREELIKKLQSLDSSINNAKAEVQTVCPTCGQPLKELDIQKNINTLVNKLTAAKESHIKEGKENSAKLKEFEIDLERNKNLRNQLCEKLEDVNKDILIIGNQIANKQSEIENIVVEKKESMKLVALNTELHELEQKLKESELQFSLGQQDISSSIKQEEDEMIPYKKVIADFEYYERQIATAKEAKEDLKNKQSELASLEQRIALLKEFIYKKLSMLDKNVSKVFGNVKFQLIQENLSGGYEQVCKPYIYDVGKGVSTNVLWRSGSKSERIATGISIAESIKKALNLPDLPFLFDEGGEISTQTLLNCFDTNSQIICVKVQDKIPSPIIVSY